MSVNIFKLKAALADLDDKSIDVGDLVTVSWSVDEAYGGGRRSHTGKLEYLDRKNGWFEVGLSSNSPGHLRSCITSSVMTFEKVKKKANPFLTKVGK